MKIKGDAGGAWTEFAVISDDGSVAEVSPRALDGPCEADSAAPARIGVVVAGFCARVASVAVVDGG
jgi:hypothetical protein